jgi:hypothetical protein
VVDWNYLKNELPLTKTFLLRPNRNLDSRQRDTISTIDLGKQPGIQRIQDVSAEHAGILHHRVQVSLTCSTTANHKINSFFAPFFVIPTLMIS